MPGMPGMPCVRDTSSNPAPGGMVQPGTCVPAACVAAAGVLIEGVAAAQLGGTDIVPTRVARPTPADTPEPGVPIEPIAAPTWLIAGAVAPENKAGLKLEPA